MIPAPRRAPRRLARLAAVLSGAALVAAGPLAASAGAAAPKPLKPAKPVSVPTLTGRALLPAATFGEKIPSGSQVESGLNGVTTPFAAQPVQGFSALLPQSGGSYLVLSDNGYGSKDNSADFLLRVHRVQPSYATGQVTVTGGFGLSDPDGRIPWPLTRADRRLTGADLDPEGFRQLPDGTFWFSEEFGPYLVHTDATGRVLSAPVPTPGVATEDDPAGRPVTLPSSKGTESLALQPDGTKLRALLEGTVYGDVYGDLRLYSFDVARGGYDAGFLKYRLASPGDSVRDMTAVDAHRFLTVEGDQQAGPDAVRKSVYLVDDRDADHDGYVDKTRLVDLLAVADPKQIGGSRTFRFPFWTIEQVALLSDTTIVVGQDNNYPYSSTRVPGRPDDSEFITVQLPQALKADARALPAP